MNPNIWSLEKDLSIKTLLVLLQQEFGEGAFIVDTDTPTDFCAIFIHHLQNPAVRAYLFTVGQQPEYYGVHLEFPLESASANLLESYENLTLKNLTEMLSVHLDLVITDDREWSC